MIPLNRMKFDWSETAAAQVRSNTVLRNHTKVLIKRDHFVLNMQINRHHYLVTKNGLSSSIILCTCGCCSFLWKGLPFIVDLVESFQWARYLHCDIRRMLDVKDESTPKKFSEMRMPRTNNLDQNSLHAYFVISGRRKLWGQSDVKAELSLRSSRYGRGQSCSHAISWDS